MAERNAEEGKKKEARRKRTKAKRNKEEGRRERREQEEQGPPLYTQAPNSRSPAPGGKYWYYSIKIY